MSDIRLSSVHEFQPPKKTLVFDMICKSAMVILILYFGGHFGFDLLRFAMRAVAGTTGFSVPKQVILVTGGLLFFSFFALGAVLCIRSTFLTYRTFSTRFCMETDGLRVINHYDSIFISYTDVIKVIKFSYPRIYFVYRYGSTIKTFDINRLTYGEDTINKIVSLLHNSELYFEDEDAIAEFKKELTTKRVLATPAPLLK